MSKSAQAVEQLAGQTRDLQGLVQKMKSGA